MVTVMIRILGEQFEFDSVSISNRDVVDSMCAIGCSIVHCACAMTLHLCFVVEALIHGH